MKNIYVFDLDNTLLERGKRNLTKNTKKLLKLLSYSDHIVILATGRGREEVYKVLLEAREYFDYFIFRNGAVLVDRNDSIIAKLPIDHETILKIKKMESTLGIYINDLDHEFGINEFDNNKEYYQMSIQGTKSDMEIVKKTANIAFYYWHDLGAHINQIGCNKVTYIKYLCQNIDYKKLIVIGDGANDVEMLKIADISILMENNSFANSERFADFIAPSVDKDLLYDFYINNHLT